MRLVKYPRTRHIEGSRLQHGDHDLKALPWSELRTRFLVIEEKLDGANSALSFDERGRQRLQSRGHFLTGGPRERHFALFKTWAAAHAGVLFDRLGSRYVVYGEWLYAKHTIFYDRLPHYFLEFDVLDREAGIFLSTPRRRALLDGLPIASVPVLSEQTADRLEAVTQLVGPTLYKSESWAARLEAVAIERRLDPALVRRQTDRTPLAEGLYIKWEDEHEVLGRYKFVRHSFLQAVEQSESHWHARPILPNQLADGVDLYASTL